MGKSRCDIFWVQEFYTDKDLKKKRKENYCEKAPYFVDDY